MCVSASTTRIGKHPGDSRAFAEKDTWPCLGHVSSLDSSMRKEYLSFLLHVFGGLIITEADLALAPRRSRDLFWFEVGTMQ